ncbi:MAG: putative DNA binding domain-containing protein [Muribaculaceae bacterium]|nr:putative DNA binding domain-containing protein [Muribaculaceae bacterium]
MALPINIDDLLNKQKIESNRIEFKRGWNPDKIYHTICDFATDLDNTGGGYILVGVEQDDNGIAKRPVKGLPIEDIDSIMQDMVGYDAKITTSNLRSIAYNSRVSKEEVDGQYILVIWVPTGPNRPYCVPESVVAKGKSPLKYYVRSKASTIEARGETLDEVRALADRTPFDERGNDAIKIEDISDILVYEHLKAVKSKLAGNFIGRPLMEVLDEMDLLVGPVENRSIKNVAAMAGPDRSISSEAIKAARKLKARRYRNRRLGDFLKELDLTEGRATGIPTIQKSLRDNGSSPAIIDTDNDRTYFLMTIPCRDGFSSEVVNTLSNVENYISDGLGQILGQHTVQVQEYINQCDITNKIQLVQILEQLFVQVWNSSRTKDNASEIISDTIDLLCMLHESPLSANELSNRLDYTSTKDLKRKMISPLIKLDYITMQIPTNLRVRNRLISLRKKEIHYLFRRNHDD